METNYRLHDLAEIDWTRRHGTIFCVRGDVVPFSEKHVQEMLFLFPGESIEIAEYKIHFQSN